MDPGEGLLRLGVEHAAHRQAETVLVVELEALDDTPLLRERAARLHRVTEVEKPALRLLFGIFLVFEVEEEVHSEPQRRGGLPSTRRSIPLDGSVARKALDRLDREALRIRLALARLTVEDEAVGCARDYTAPLVEETDPEQTRSQEPLARRAGDEAMVEAAREGVVAVFEYPPLGLELPSLGCVRPEALETPRDALVGTGTGPSVHRGIRAGPEEKDHHAPIGSVLLIAPLTVGELGELLILALREHEERIELAAALVVCLALRILAAAEKLRGFDREGVGLGVLTDDIHVGPEERLAGIGAGVAVNAEALFALEGLYGRPRLCARDPVGDAGAVIESGEHGLNGLQAPVVFSVLVELFPHLGLAGQQGVHRDRASSTEALVVDVVSHRVGVAEDREGSIGVVTPQARELYQLLVRLRADE